MDCQVVELRRYPRRYVHHHCILTQDLRSTTTGAAGDWQDDGACPANGLKQGQYVTAHYESKSVPLTVPVQTPAGTPKKKNSRVYKF